MKTFTTADFDYHLPLELIAQHPAAERSGARLLDARQTGAGNAVHRIFKDLPNLVQPGDLVVFNDTQVVNARLYGQKPSGGAVELLIERVLPSQQANEVAAHLKANKKPAVGTVVLLDRGKLPPAVATVLGRWPAAGSAMFHLRLDCDPYTLMADHGHVPLPPYITHADDATDAARYQTVLAKNPGAVAAPTAALHFDEAVLAALDARGAERLCVTLHVGAGTFQPVKTEQIDEHVMHSERYAISSAVCRKISDTLAKNREKRAAALPTAAIWAVGTTSVRSLESWAQLGMPIPAPGDAAGGVAGGDTNIFITPGFEFQVVDHLVTNFHLPKSTLMMLISAFAGHRHVMDTYALAVAERYRFFSYGDSMLLSRSNGAN